MRRVPCLLAFLILLSLGGASHAADAPACIVPGPADGVGSITQLPADVQTYLLDNGPVSDVGGPFNATDLVDAVNPVPDQRLISGLAGPDAICLQLEHGGRGYHHVILYFQHVGTRWTLVSRVNRMAPKQH